MPMRMVISAGQETLQGENNTKTRQRPVLRQKLRNCHMHDIWAAAFDASLPRADKISAAPETGVALTNLVRSRSTLV